MVSRLIRWEITPIEASNKKGQRTPDAKYQNLLLFEGIEKLEKKVPVEENDHLEVQ